MAQVIEDYEFWIRTYVDRLLDVTKELGEPELLNQVILLKEAIQEQKNFLKLALTNVQPKDKQALEDMTKPMSIRLTPLLEFASQHRSSHLFHHFSAISEGSMALNWIFVSPSPVSFIGDMREAAQYYANRVLKEVKFKNTDHTNWINFWMEALGELQVYVKKHHTTGVCWAKMGTVNGSLGGSSPFDVSSGATISPLSQKPKEMNISGPRHMTQLFQSINVGEEISSGLKHVDKSQMTHKNPSLRKTVPMNMKDMDGVTEVSPRSDINRTQSTKPTKFCLEGNKWIIENFTGNHDIIIEKVELRHSVYIFNCTNCTISIKGKLNQVSLDSCKKTGVLVETVISSIETVNCQDLQLQIMHKSPTVAIDKTDGVQLFLGNDGLDVELFTSKSSCVNVSIPKEHSDNDYTEFAIPELFKTLIQGRKFQTYPVENKS